MGLRIQKTGTRNKTLNLSIDLVSPFHFNFSLFLDQVTSQLERAKQNFNFPKIKRDRRAWAKIKHREANQLSEDVY